MSYGRTDDALTFVSRDSFVYRVEFYDLAFGSLVKPLLCLSSGNMQHDLKRSSLMRILDMRKQRKYIYFLYTEKVKYTGRPGGVAGSSCLLYIGEPREIESLRVHTRINSYGFFSCAPIDSRKAREHE